MEKLWSPWRSNYIESFKYESDKDACVFCEAPKLAMKDDKSLVVYKSEKCYAMLNLYPYNNGHLMVIPYRHLSDILDLTKEEFEDIGVVLKLAKKAIGEVMKPEGFNIGANIGKAAGAGIDQHVHFHIVPRWNGDTNFMPALGEIKVISQDLLETKKTLTKAFDELTKEN